jgi:hypothetical protein
VLIGHKSQTVVKKGKYGEDVVVSGYDWELQNGASHSNNLQTSQNGDYVFKCAIPVMYSVTGKRIGKSNTTRVKVKDSRNRPGVAQRVPGGLGSHIFMTFGA